MEGHHEGSEGQIDLDDFKVLLGYYKEKCGKLERDKKLLEQELDLYRRNGDPLNPSKVVDLEFKVVALKERERLLSELETAGKRISDLETLVHLHTDPQARSLEARLTAAGPSTGHDQYADLPPIHRAIILFIVNTPHGAEGVNVAAIARHVAGPGQGTTPQHVCEAIESLIEDGHIYATIDESHFAVI